ncbi:cutinase family protein [Nocardioides sp. GY 10113]|uniref:cutinase family protein n=1 Tax=Nocardioides sp. GY 10113 TaxID=2569761 RepID=UPI001458381B|nr:cutinase family protein [Nocardioides sp. GY 10113]
MKKMLTLAVALVGLAALPTPADAAPPGGGGTPPPAPTKVTVSVYGSGYKVAWTKVTGAVAYTVEVSAVTGAKGALTTKTVTAKGSTVTSAVVPAITTAMRGGIAKPTIKVQAINSSARKSPWRYAAAKAVPCASGYIVDVRGSGQSKDVTGRNPKISVQGKEFAKQIRKAVGVAERTLPSIWVNYPAVGALNAATAKFHLSSTYTNSVKAGVTALNTTMNAIEDACPNAKVILFGYSQGAQATGNWLASSSADRHLDQIRYTALLADPTRNAADHRVDRGSETDSNGFLTKRAKFEKHRFVGSWCDEDDDFCAGYGFPLTNGIPFHHDTAPDERLVECAATEATTYFKAQQVLPDHEPTADLSDLDCD